jgi:lipopolysaccharide export system protein LptA
VMQMSLKSPVKTSLLGVAGFAFTAAVMMGSAAIGQNSSSPFSGHNSNAPLSWSAENVDVQDAANRVVLTGGVTAQQENLALNAGRVTIAYSKGSGKISVDRLDASGGVTFKRARDTARGDFAVYDFQRKIITLVGNVVLEQERGVVRGGRLVIDLNSNRGTLGGDGPATANSPGGRVSGSFEVSKGN